MSESILLMMLGIGLLVTAAIAKKLINPPQTPRVMPKRPARDLKTISQFIHNKEAFDNRG